VPHPRAARVGLSFLKAFCVIPSPARGGINSAGNLSSIYYGTKICVGIRRQSTYLSCGLIRRKCCAVLTVQPSWRSPPDSAHREERPRVRPDACASPRSRRAQCLLSYSVGPVLPERDGQRDRTCDVATTSQLARRAVGQHRNLALHFFARQLRLSLRFEKLPP